MKGFDIIATNPEHTTSARIQVILFRLHTLKNDSILPCGNIFPEGGRGDEKGSHCFAFDT
jgi:hypothetical protein